MPRPTPPSALYHISQIPGLKEFLPRRCWFNATRNCSGMLADAADPPQGCVVRYCVFAGELPYMRYFCIPSHMKRFSIRGDGDAFAAAAAALGIVGTLPEEVLVLEQQDREAIRTQRMHLYTFDPASFVQYPSGEYVSEQPVVPISERAVEDPLMVMCVDGIQVAFVADIEQRFDACHALGAPFGVVANIEGSRKLLGG